MIIETFECKQTT